MDNQFRSSTPNFGSGQNTQAPPPTPDAVRPLAGVPQNPAPFSPTPTAPSTPTPPTPAPQPVQTVVTPPRPRQPLLTPKRRIILIALLILLLLAGAGFALSLLVRPKQQADTVELLANRYDVVQIPLDDLLTGNDVALLGTRSLAINGPLRLNDNFILSPSAQPSAASAGQIYYDQTSNELAYFNGSQFVALSGELTTGDGISNTNGVLANTGVLSVQGQTGAVAFTAGNGIAIDGLTLSNTGVTSLGDATGDIAIGNGLSLTNGTLSNSGVNSLTAGTLNLTITNDGAGNLTISDVGGGSGTVQSPGGTAGRIAKFTGVQTIADSLLSESGTMVTVDDDLTVTDDLTVNGNLILSTPLGVSNGGTGATALTTNGVVIGQGAGALTVVTAGGAGLCFQSTAGAPTFAACPGGVTSVNGLSGVLSIANASGAGSTITINDASTAQKGIAQFNNVNFSASGGTINTIQNINSAATPTFAGVNTNAITPSAALTVGSTTQQFTLQGNASSVINATSGVNSTTLSFQAPTAVVNYRFATASAGTYDVCTTVGNCAGTGGGVTTPGGTLNTIPKFTGTQTLGDSLISESGSTITINGNLNLTTGNQLQINGTQISSANLSNDSNLAKLDATQIFTGNSNTFRNGSNSATAFSIQNAATSRVLTVDTTAGEVELGQGSAVDGRLVFSNATNNNTITIVSSVASSPQTITLPNDTGTICLSTGNCAGAGVTLQSAYNNSTSPEITVDATRGALTVRDNATPIAANLLEVQNNAGSTTYLAVTSSGVSVTGTTTSTGNINSSGGALQTSGTTRIDGSGNATNIGSLTLSGAISGGTTYSGSGNINTSGGALQTAGTSRVDNSGNLVNIGNLTATGALTIASSGAGNDITIDGADQFIVQDASVFNALSTFNSDVDLALADTENLSITNTVTGTNSVNLIGAVLTNNTSSGTQQVALLQNASGSGATEGLLVLDNADTDTAVANGLQITSAAGGITTAVDVSDPDITTALLFGLNDIAGTNFSVTGATGSFTSAGNATIQGGIVTVGTASQAGSLVVHDGDGETATIGVADLGGNRNITIPAATGDDTICLLSLANCVGTGGGVTGSGTNNRITKFTSTGSTVGDSTISDNGTTVTTTVDVIVQGGELTVGTSSQLASLILHDGGGETTTLQAGNSGGNLTFILPTTAGTSNQCLKQSGTGNQLVWADCDGGGGGSSATLQTAYNNGASITTTDARDIDIVLANTTTDSNFDVVVADGSTSFVSLSRADGAGTADPAQLLLINNLDTTRAVPIGIKLQAAGGGLTTAIDATDAEIIDAISVDANNIVGTTGNIDFSNFDVAGATGSITTAGDLAVNGGNITSTGVLNLNATTTIELQDSTNVTGNLDVSGTLTSGTGNAFQVGATGDITSAGNAVIQGGSLTVGTSSQGGTVVIYDGSTHRGSFVTAALSDHRTYTLPDATGEVCLSTGNCAGASTTLQAAYDASTNPEIVVDTTRGALTVRDNATPIAANLLEVQSNNGATTYFGVTASGVSITGTATATGAINSSGGAIQTNSTNRIDNSGNLVNIGNITATGALTIASTGAGNDIILDSADTIELQDATNIAGDLQVNGGDINTASSASGTALNVKPGGVTNANGTGVALGLQGGDATSATCGTACTGGDVTIAGGTATGGAGTRVGGNVTINAGTGASSNGLINIGTTTGAVTIGSTSTASSVTLRAANSGNIFIGSSGTTASVQIGNTTGAVSQAISIGNNNTGSSTSTVTIGSIIGTSSSSLRSGATGSLTLNAGGTNVLTGTASTLALLSTTTSINHNFNGATNINTGTSTSTITLGGGSGALVIDSTAFDVTSAGAVSGVTTLSTSGIITQGALGTANTATYLCYNASNQIANCNTTGTGAAFVQGGNDFNATAILGTNDTDALQLETNNAARLTIGASGGVTLEAANALTVTSALTSLTGATTGDALNVSNSTSTGNIAVFKDNATNVATIADGGAATFQNSTNSANAFRVLNSGGGELVGADSSSSILRLLANNTGELIGTGPSTPAGGWTPGATLTSPRGSGATLVVNGYLYSIAGGDTGGGTNDVYYTKLNSDGSMSGWIQTTDYPYNVFDHSVATYNGYIYGHGGTGSAATGQDLVYAKPNADGSISAWTIQDNPTNLVNHSLAGMQTHNGYVYITGGSDASTRRNVYYGRINGDGSVPTFTVKTNWLPASTEFSSGQVIIANGFMYVMGSANYDKFWYGRIMASGEPGTPAGATGVASQTANNVSTARKYASLAVMNGYLYVIAGATNGLTTTEYAPFASDGNISTAFTIADIEFPQALTVCPMTSPTYNGYIYVVACGDTGFNPLDLTFYASGSRVKVGGSLDLTGYSGDGASEGQTGGQLTTGNAAINGLLSVTGNAVFKDGVAVSNALSVQAYSNTNAVFGVLNASGVPQFTVDNSNSRVYIGNQTSDTTGALLVLDTKSDANDPTGVNGGMYYSTNTNTFRCYENSVWYDCISRHKIVLGSDVTDSAGNACTMTDITGLTFSVTSGTNYRFHANLIYTAAATTTGARFSVNGPATPTLLSFTTHSGLTATTESIDYVNAYDGGTCSATSPSAAAQGNTATVEGVIRPSASGTFAMRVGTEVDTSAIVVKAGSTLEWW